MVWIFSRRIHPLGLTINNLNKYVVRHFEDQALSGLKPNSDKTVTNPSLKAGVSGYTPYRGFSPDGKQHEVVLVIYCQSLSGYYLINNMKKRVVITGLGVVSSLGCGKEAFWNNL